MAHHIRLKYQGGNLTLTRLVASTSFLLIAAGAAFGNTPVIGMATAQNGLTLDNAKVGGNATLFDGSTVQANGYSRIQLKNGTRLDLGTDSKARIFANRATLESGMSEVQSPSGFEVEAQTLRIRPAEASSIARVKLDGGNRVLVTALIAPVNVWNRDGLLVARVNPGSPLSFQPVSSLPEGVASGAFDSTGCVLQKSGAAVIVDQTGNQVFELRGADLRKVVGNTARVIGSSDPSATAAGGASQVVKVSSAMVTTKGGCDAQAAKLGAVTTAAGLSAAAGAGVGSGAYGAGGGASVGISTTVLIIGGIIIGTGIGLGAAAAAGAFNSSSP
jgi:hypothetical protein